MPNGDSARPRWPGMDSEFRSALLAAGRTEAGVALRKRAEDRFMFAEGKPFLLGPAQMVSADHAEEMKRVTRIYHRAIERIVHASATDERVRNVLSTPSALSRDLALDTASDRWKVHICRLDLMLDPEGSFWILETNANCPGGFVFAGMCNRAWREFMEAQGYPMPRALDHEEKAFMAKWFLRVIQEDTGERPDFVGLLREEGGNRFELGDFAKHLEGEGVDCAEIDPREIEYDGSAPPRARGRDVRFAYLKYGMQRYMHHRDHIEPFVRAVRDGALFVQNGQRPRWVGDDKLCLAIISDPRFADLFDPAELEELRTYVPWSRSAAMLEPDALAHVRAEPGRFVLKRGLDTRGLGVVVGSGVSESQWRDALAVATREGWLVQRFHPTSWVERDFDDETMQRHDLALGAINGELTTLFSRSSGELRVNMARTGRMHPIFMG